MRLIELPTLWTVLLDIAAWAVIQPLIGWIAMSFPERWLNPAGWLFRERRWENGGEPYQKIFHVKNWKDKLPYGGSLFQDQFSMKEIGEKTAENIERWMIETCRSELTHWIAILPGFLFFLWNKWEIGFVMVVYALLFNLPLVLVQRYNRPRLCRLRHILSAREISIHPQ